MSEVRIALTTVGSPDEARRLARALVERRLAACVNILDAVQSIYRWQGAVEEARELLLIIKTDRAHLSALEASLRDLHSYSLPEFLVLAPESGSDAYFGWIAESLA